MKYLMMVVLVFGLSACSEDPTTNDKVKVAVPKAPTVVMDKAVEPVKDSELTDKEFLEKKGYVRGGMFDSGLPSRSVFDKDKK